MRFRPLLGFLLALGLAGCKKDSIPAPPAPVARFDVVGTATADVITVGTYDPIQVKNTSANAVAYEWTLGNDSTKTGRNPGLFRYPKAGTYTLTLTARDASGQKATASRRVKVLDRVIKQIVVVGTRFENASVPNAFSALAVRAVLRLAPTGQSYPTPSSPYASYDAPIIFQSPLLPLSPNTQFPYTIPVPGKLVLDYAALNAQFTTQWGYAGKGYGLELYVLDATKSYLASSSYEALYRSQAGNISIRVADISRNLFVAQYSNIQVVCAYE
ncbi:MAG TPA: PKD domain-containing protein [Hymenobacter sp.]|jgi:hypothetical protein